MIRCQSKHPSMNVSGTRGNSVRLASSTHPIYECKNRNGNVVGVSVVDRIDCFRRLSFIFYIQCDISATFRARGKLT